jgi:predicted HicB family RNase H-like nuclease
MMGRDEMKKQKQAKLEGEFQSMTLRVPIKLHKQMAKNRKATKKSFNKMTIEALELYLRLMA